MDRWKLAQDGEGQVVLLSGEPGIGKSRVLSELRARLESTGARSLRLHCSPYYANSAFYPIIDNFERALHFDRDATAEQKLDQLEALIVGEYGCRRGDLRFIAAMLSIPCDERGSAVAMTPQKFKDETLRALVDVTEAIAHRQPTVMLFEDAHWADPTTLELLDLLIHRVRNVPLLVVLTHRPEFLPRGSHHGHVAALGLTKLTRGQSRALVSRLIGGKALPGDLLEQILEKTDGVPLFVEELTKSILESGAVRDAGNRWEYLGPVGALAIPATLRDSLMARLEASPRCARSRRSVPRLGANFPTRSSPPSPHGVHRSWSGHWRSSSNRDWPSSRARRPTRPILSNTPWCRTPPTTRCSSGEGRNCTAKSPKRSRCSPRGSAKPNPSCWRATTPRRNSPRPRSRCGSGRAAWRSRVRPSPRRLRT
jgi:hypothetical protein